MRPFAVSGRLTIIVKFVVGRLVAVRRRRGGTLAYLPNAAVPALRSDIEGPKVSRPG